MGIKQNLKFWIDNWWTCENLVNCFWPNFLEFASDFNIWLSKFSRMHIDQPRKKSWKIPWRISFSWFLFWNLHFFSSEFPIWISYIKNEFYYASTNIFISFISSSFLFVFLSPLITIAVISRISFIIMYFTPFCFSSWSYLQFNIKQFQSSYQEIEKANLLAI